jgi:hypothetical protein
MDLECCFGDFDGLGSGVLYDVNKRLVAKIRHIYGYQDEHFDYERRSNC